MDNSNGIAGNAYLLMGLPDEREWLMTDEESVAFEESVDDDMWLAMVAVLLTKYTGDLNEAIASIEANREKCLVARSIGIETWEMSQFAAAQMGLKVA